MNMPVSVFHKALGVKRMTIYNANLVPVVVMKDGEEFVRHEVHLNVAPYKSEQCRCPHCLEKCPKYDRKRETPSRWRGPDWNGMHVQLLYTPYRVECPKHGVVTEWLPWSDGNTRQLASFNDEVTYQALHATRNAVAEFFDINWRTVGNCIAATHARIEPDVTDRLRGLKRISVDEVSTAKGHKYITSVVNSEGGSIVWLHRDHGDSIFILFAESLTEEERLAIEVVSGDGARWIDRIIKLYFPNAKRCIDPFHAVAWATEAMDDVRKSLDGAAKRQLNKERAEIEKDAEQRKLEWNKEYAEYCRCKEELAAMPVRRGRTSNQVKQMRATVSAFEAQYNEAMDLYKKAKKGILTEEQETRLKELEAKADSLKGCKYALGMAPENLSRLNAERLEMIKVSNPEAYEAYKLKEQIRIIFHMKDVKQAWKAMEEWICAAMRSPFKPFQDLARKIFRHRHNIKNTIELGENSSLSEQTNGLVRRLIARANGFHNDENMFHMIYLCCSELVIPLGNRYRPSVEKERQRRERARLNRQRRREQRRAGMEGDAA